MHITALYAAPLALFYLVLTGRTILFRRANKISIGDGGNPAMLRRMRVHGNFAEYAPLALLLMALAESMHAAPWMMHALGVSLVVGRLTHAAGLAQEVRGGLLRVAGMAVTLTHIGAAAVLCLLLATG
jgi:uncharacterized protein